MVGLAGQLSNPIVKTKWANLQGGLAELRTSSTPVRPSERPRAVRARGQVRDLIIHLLQKADQPIRARDIHRAVEQVLGEEVAWSSIAYCLARNDPGSEARIENIRLGLYRLRK